MIHDPRTRRRNRIKHRLGMTELAIRFLLLLGCVTGMSYLGLKLKAAVENRLRQKALVAEVTASARDDGALRGPSEVGGAEVGPVVSVHENRNARSTDTRDVDPTGIDSPITQRASTEESGHGMNKTKLIQPVATSGSAPAAQSMPEGAMTHEEVHEQTHEQTIGANPKERNLKSAARSLPEPSDDLISLFSAPNVTLTRMSDGQTFEPLGENLGCITVLDFWASWCGPCLQELPVVARVVSMYTPDQVRLIAVNTEENAERVRAFVNDRSIEVEVALDPRGEAAAAFGVEQLPTLVLIDQQGVVRRIHVGFSDRLAQTLRGELETLLSGRKLSTDVSVASYLQESRNQSTGSLELTTWKDRASRNRHTEDMPIRLTSGEEVKVGSRFNEAKAAFEELLEETLNRNDDRVTKLTYGEPGKLSLVFSRRGKELHGPLASFYQDGTSLAYVQYRFGKRISSLLTWDASGRPLVMEEYDSGLRDGLRCIFKSCGEQCKTGHLWMAQEWRKGELLASHVVLNDGRVALMDHDLHGQAEPDPDGYLERSLAAQELDDFEKRLDGDEAKIKKSLGDYYGMLRRRMAMQVQSRLSAAGARTHPMPSSYATGRSLPYPFRSPAAFLPRPMTIRNCGSS